MPEVTVKYNNVALSPTPTVSRSYQFIDYGKRFGQTEQIELEGFLTGYTSTADALSKLTTTFAGQFRTLEVLGEDSSSVYKWDNLVLEELSLPQNSFPQLGFTTYNARFTAYQIPSGVLDPINEYSFSEGEDGFVTVNHKISARGVRTNNVDPIDNAIAFVNLFVKKNPYTACAPAFISNGSGILMNISESLDRTSSTYSVTENYKFTTGAGALGYLRTVSLSTKESIGDDYKLIDLSVKLQGSPVENGFANVQAAAQTLDLNGILTEYGVSPTKVARETFGVTERSGDCSVEFKASYISGVDSDVSGYFDYSISMDRDFVPSRTTWRVEGEFSSKGSIDTRRAAITAFKTANQGDSYIPYLSGLVTASALYTGFASGYALTPNQVTYTEDTGRAVLKLGATFNDYDTFANFYQPSYTVEVEPSRWIYEMMPSANIEGHYVIQDLQMKNQSKIKLSFNGNTTGSYSGDLTNVNILLNSISGIYAKSSSFLMSQNQASGQTNVSVSLDLLGGETMAEDFLTTKVFGGFGSNYVRQPGYKFGY
jgi:hypothetical protein